jgi:hypothetical protein
MSQNPDPAPATNPAILPVNSMSYGSADLASNS